MNRRVLLGGAATVVAGAAGWMVLRPQDQPVLSALAQVSSGEGTEGRVPDMVMGAEDAPVTVVEYASFTCPHCATFHTNVFRRLKETYIDTGRVRYVYREVFFDRPGLWAAMVARCGGEQRYFGIADMIYDRQRQWTQGDAATVAGNLRTIGKTAGLTDEALDACLTDGETAQAMVATFEENSARDGIDSTPSFLIDGQKYGNMSYEDFARILDEKLGG
jgi:protein-disulfide isomerase